MSSRLETAKVRLSYLALILLSVIFAGPSFSAENENPAGTETWLVTYGPGEVYWQRFGHNAIWIRDAGLGLDHVFNFGFFDFEQEDFFLRFLQGRMLYFSAAQPASKEFAAYINENRSIRAQRLNLSGDQKLRLVEYLLQEVRPENRDYLYDYYLNNCSTRIRDAIDLALDGLLEKRFSSIEAPQSWRDQTRRLTSGDFWLYLGLEIGLGSPVDRAVSRWDEMFIPQELAETLAGVSLSDDGYARPLVVEDVLLHQSTLEPPPPVPRTWWPRYLLASLGVVLLASLLCRYVPPLTVRDLSGAWFVLSGVAGLGLLFLWFGTDHAVTRMNLNLLVFCPVWALLPFLRGHEKTSLLLVTGCSLLALAMTFLPPHQYNQDVLAAFLPINLFAAYALFRTRKSSARPPGVPAAEDR